VLPASGTLEVAHTLRPLVGEMLAAPWGSTTDCEPKTEERFTGSRVPGIRNDEGTVEGSERNIP